MRSLLFIVFTACGPTITTTPLNASPRAMHGRDSDSVAVRTGVTTPNDSVAVALITVDTGGRSTMLADLIPAARARAASLGCDSILLDVANAPVEDGGFSFSCLVKRP